MTNLSKTFKAGEKVSISGRYECLICKYGGTRTEVELQEKAIFPMCKVDAIQDATWQLIQATAVAAGRP